MVYDEKLYNALKESEYIYEIKSNRRWRRNLQRYFDMYDWSNLEKRIEQELKNSQKNVFLVNSYKIYTLSKEFGVKEDVEAQRGSICFTILGCVLDGLLDEGTMNQKKEVYKYLSWEYIENYINKETKPHTSSVIDYLYSEWGKIAYRIQREDREKYDIMYALLYRLVDSEKFITNSQVEMSERQIADKSELFVVLALILALNRTEEYERLMKLATSIGRVFSLIDDLCDRSEDMVLGQKNIVIAKLSQGDSEEAVISELIRNIDEEFCKIQELGNNEIYEMILREVQEWTMSNDYIRERVWFEYG